MQLSTLGGLRRREPQRDVLPRAVQEQRLPPDARALADQLGGALRAADAGLSRDLAHRSATRGEKQLVGGAPEGDGFDVEPIYGKFYMPRKFKMAIGYTFDNCVDLYANDLGLMAVTEGDEIVGYNLLVGGGMGVTPSAKKTFPAVAKRMCYVEPGEVLRAVEAVFKVQRDFGNREDRKLARLKYVIANWGVEKFKAKVEEYYGGPLADPLRRRRPRLQRPHGLGRAGRRPLVLWPERRERPHQGHAPRCGSRRRSAKSASTLQPSIRLTSHQSMLFGDIRAAGPQPAGEHSAVARREADAKRFRRSAAGAWPASPGRPAACRSPKASGPCPA